MIARIAMAVIVAVVVGLLCLLVSDLLTGAGAGVPVLIAVGGFLGRFGWLLGLLAGAWFFFSGATWPRRSGPPG